MIVDEVIRRWQGQVEILHALSRWRGMTEQRRSVIVDFGIARGGHWFTSVDSVGQRNAVVQRCRRREHVGQLAESSIEMILECRDDDVIRLALRRRQLHETRAVSQREIGQLLGRDERDLIVVPRHFVHHQVLPDELVDEFLDVFGPLKASFDRQTCPTEDDLHTALGLYVHTSVQCFQLLAKIVEERTILEQERIAAVGGRRVSNGIGLFAHVGRVNEGFDAHVRMIDSHVETMPVNEMLTFDHSTHI